jgi:hypothetical protein
VDILQSKVTQVQQQPRQETLTAVAVERVELVLFLLLITPTKAAQE